MKSGIEKTVSIILAGGEGTRLFPLTKTRCKPAVSFGGRYRLIDIPLSHSLNSKIPQTFVISQYFASHLNQHIIASHPTEFFQNRTINLLCPEETPSRKVWFKGTADAIRQNLDHLLETKAEYFLILSGDQLYNMDFGELVDFAMKHDADLVIGALPVKESEAKRMGLLKINGSSKVVDFYEKPSDSAILNRYLLADGIHYLGSMGIYVFKREALIDLLQEEGEDFGRHLLLAEVKKGKTFAYSFSGYWEDIGTIGSYYQANLALTQQGECFDIYNENQPIYTPPHHLPSPVIKNTFVKNSLISQGALIEAKEIAHSLIGLRVHIKKESVIKDTIVIGNEALSQCSSSFSIGENCLIERTIIDEYAQIGNNVRLINKNRVEKMDGDGIYIRDGIIIVTTGTSIPDGFIL